MKAIILAAGRGSRMGSLTDNTPKCLIELAGKTLLQRQLDSLRGAGIDKIGIVRGYLADQLYTPGIKFFENKRWEKTNMVFSLSCAKEWLQRDECIVSYSDIIYSINAIDVLIKAHGDIVITYDKNWLKLWKVRFEDPLSDAETFQVDDKGKLLEIGKKANDIDEIKGQYMGLLKISTKGWKIIYNYLSNLSREEYDLLCITSMLQNLIQSGVEISAVPISDCWYEVDNENDLKLYQSIMKW
ncbi:MAG: phosphocholine cytidylyltransferase family protein [Candidatus Methanoperedens sp.]